MLPGRPTRLSQPQRLCCRQHQADSVGPEVGTLGPISLLTTAEVPVLRSELLQPCGLIERWRRRINLSAEMFRQGEERFAGEPRPNLCDGLRQTGVGAPGRDGDGLEVHCVPLN